MPGPTIRRRQLGRRLRQLRATSGKPARDVAEWLDISTATLSKVENGKQAAKIAHVRLLLQLYGVDAGESEELLRIAREAGQRGWWTSYADAVPDWFRDYIGLESDAAELWTYDAERIHGLLQTSRYVQAVCHAGQDDADAEELASRVGLRDARQGRLTGGEPPDVVSIVSEGAVRRLVGGRVVMREQLEHLLEMSELPHVTFQVLPFDAGAHPGMNSPFTLLRFEQDLGMDAVYLDNDIGALYVERPDDVRRYAENFGRLRKQARTPKQTRDLLAGLVRDL